jgi:glucose dehydrogenase
MKKNIKKFISFIMKFSLSILLLFLLFLFIDMTSISFKYANKDILSFDLDNIRNKKLKKITNFFDQYYENFLAKNFYKHNSYYNPKISEEIKEFPEEIVIKSSNNLTLTNNKNINNFEDWRRSHGNSHSNRFSSLKNVNLENISRLDVAWTYQFSETGWDIQSNIIFADGKVFIPSTKKHVVALNAYNGQELWKYETKQLVPARRGLIFYKDKNNKSQIIFCNGRYLTSILSEDGKPNDKFGKKGLKKIDHNCSVAPVIVDDKLIIATFEPSLDVYDLYSGKLLWKYYLKEKYTENRVGGQKYNYQGGHPWGGISADEERKIVYITTGNPDKYFTGINRPGKNKYSNSIIAIDLNTKKKLWDFQEVEHDIWNLDIPAPPVLTSIVKNGKKVDVVVSVTKLGNTIILDRVNGNLLFDFHKKKAPQSNVPGEKTAIYQPALKLPEPFTKQFFKKDDVTNISKESQDYVEKQLLNKNFGFFIPNSVGKDNIQYGFNGGAEWMGASINNNNGMMYVTANSTPYITTLIEDEKNKIGNIKKYKSLFKIFTDQYDYPASAPPWGTLTSLDLNSGKIIWQVPFGEYEELSEKGINKTGTYNMGGVTGTEAGILFATGTIDKKIRVFDSSNGKEVWSYKMSYIGSSPPTTYLYNNEQFVIVAATGSTSLSIAYPKKVEVGNKIYAFKIK